MGAISISLQSCRVLLTKQLKWDNDGHEEAIINNATTLVFYTIVNFVSFKLQDFYEQRME